MDGVCGTLREEKAGVYAQMLCDCRKYSPDLIVLNHRLNLYEAEKYVTTFLWQGAETYVDVHSANRETCMHHRGFIFERGLPEDLERLAEDHGVCLSSSVAYFEDDLIYQAFGRSMILAPEIYGNPWLLRDDEYPKLARIFNLHKQCASILVDGKILPACYGPSAVSRGTPDHRLITTGNNTWKTGTVRITLGEEIGLETDEKIALIQRHPSEKLIGIFEPGETAEAELLPFRAHLFEAAAVSKAYPVLENCTYEVVREDEHGVPTEVRLFCTEGGDITLLNGGKRTPFMTADAVDIREKAPQFLGTMTDNSNLLSRGEELYEAAQFGITNDSLEARELRRAGTTRIPEVQAARDAFFDQLTYRARGCEGRYAFDGKPDTFFDAYSRYYGGSQRLDGGCLRVDFGSVFDADTVEIVCFAIDEPVPEVFAQQYPKSGTYSCNLAQWHDSGACCLSVVSESVTAPVVRNSVHTIYNVSGRQMKAEYPIGEGGIRYFRLPCPMDRIYSIRLLKDGHPLPLTSPTVSNLQAPWEKKTAAAVKSVTITLPDVSDGDYLAAALNGIHGREGAYCTAEWDGELHAFPDRAPAYMANNWEHCVRRTDRNCTYYLPLTKSMSGRKITVHTLFCDSDKTDVRCDLYLCPKH